MSDYEYFLLWSKTDEFKEKVNEARRIIKNALDLYGSDKCFISFSGGKDSTVLLNLVYSIDKNVLVVHWDYGKYFIPRKIHEEIINILKWHDAKYIVATSTAYERYKRKARNVLGRHYIGKFLKYMYEQGYRLVFIGLRKEESIRRKIRLKDYFEKDKSGLINCYPIMNWSYKDVWAYIYSRKIPYLSVYDRYNKVLGHNRSRFVTLFDKEFEDRGGYYIDKYLFFEYYHF